MVAGTFSFKDYSKCVCVVEVCVSPLGNLNESQSVNLLSCYYESGLELGHEVWRTMNGGCLILNPSTPASPKVINPTERPNKSSYDPHL